MSLVCMHAKCIHRVDQQCGLLLAGKQVLLNVAGQCEMMEEETIQPEPGVGQPCQRHHCTNIGVGKCSVCNVTICAQHRSWIPTQGENYVPYCDICIMRHVHFMLGNKPEFRRDDHDDPDDPWDVSS